MAGVAESQNDSSSKTILRVKRKRSEDPADILLVSHAFKKSFREDNQLNSEEGTNSVQRVFKLAGTVSKDDDNVLSQEILNKLARRGGHKSKVKVNPSCDLTVESISEKLRETKKLANQKSRYKVISKHREEEEDLRKLKENENNENKNVDDTTKEAFRLYKLYDIAIEGTEPGEVKKESPKVDEDPNTILCNSVKMIREKLKIDNGPDKNLGILEKDYVYDVYCAEDNYGELSEVLDIVHLNQSQLVVQTDDDLEHYDDEDDSNDENNWRNDYPDEEEWGESSEEESRYISENFDYGWEDRYGSGYGQRMFSENFSSDEDHDYAYFGKKFGEYGDEKYEYNFEIVDEED